jgi:hypothetical protein
MVNFLVFSTNEGECGFDLCRQNNNQSQFIRLLPAIVFAKVDEPKTQEIGIVLVIILFSQGLPKRHNLHQHDNIIVSFRHYNIVKTV